MREKSNGIVLNMVPYNDKSSFVHIYTEKFGTVTYSVPNTRGKRTRMSKALFIPFNILEMEVEHAPGREIQKMAEVRPVGLHLTLLADPVKGAVTLFLAEFLSRTIREQEPNPTLYRFIADSFALYDILEEGKANFHLVFLLKISEFLGFRINRESFREGYGLDMLEGTFTSGQPEHAWFLNPAEAYLFHTILQMQYSNMHTYQLNREHRTVLLDQIVLYFRLHLPELREIKSLEVLKSLFQ